MLNKVPEVTLFFWIIKVLATTVGETAADYLSVDLGLGLTATTYVMSALLVTVLVVQFRARRYTPSVYWLAVVLLSIVGTLITDNLVDHFGVSLETTTTLFASTVLPGAGCVTVIVGGVRSSTTLYDDAATTSRSAMSATPIEFGPSLSVSVALNAPPGSRSVVATTVPLSTNCTLRPGCTAKDGTFPVS